MIMNKDENRVKKDRQRRLFEVENNELYASYYK